jgi:hypothetical protein
MAQGRADTLAKTALITGEAWPLAVLIGYLGMTP